MSVAWPEEGAMLRYHPYEPDFVARVRAGGPDDYGRPAERAVSNGDGVPCRSCLRQVPAGRAYLIVAARPFPEVQPYAETGPIFLCADDCEAWAGEGVPRVLASAPDYLVKGYSGDHRIVYGTGAVVPAGDLAARAEAILDEARVAFVDVRSARNNCFQARLTRA
jgi:hypothetical protein